MPRTRSFDRMFTGELRNFISLVNTLSTDMSWKDLAKQSQLSVGCVFNLCTGITQSPHFRTIYKIGLAVGIDVSFGDKTLKLSKAA